MKFFSRLFVMMLFAFAAVVAPPGHAQSEASPQKSSSKPAPAEMDTQKKNIQEYINLLRSDVRQQKAEIMGSLMALSAADAAMYVAKHTKRHRTEMPGKLQHALFRPEN